MLRFKKIVFQSIALVAIVLFSNFSSSAQDGKAIFQANCASCHNPIKDATGPALQGVDKRVPSKEWIYNWVHNSAKVISSGDKYANDLYNKWNKTAMTAFPQLSNAEIDAVVKYVNDYKAPSSTPAAGASSQAAPEEDNSNMYILVTLALLVLMVILWKVNSGLKRVANEKQGLPNVKEIPFYRNKLFVAIAIILAFILAGYWIANGSIEMGRQQNYKPEQPIFYSHKVHAGINQINCLYCHAGAEKSKHAMVPSTNVCMNCHKQINEYTGEAHDYTKFNEDAPIGYSLIFKENQYVGRAEYNSNGELIECIGNCE